MGEKKKKDKKKEVSIGKKFKQKTSDSTGLIFIVSATIIILLLLIGPVAYKKYKSKKRLEENKYRGFDFYKNKDGSWRTEYWKEGQPYIIPFYHHPRELDSVVYEDGVEDKILRKPKRLFIAMPPDGGSKVVVAGVEISKITGFRYNLLNIPTRSALTEQSFSENSSDYPVVDCSSATNKTGVVRFKKGEFNKVYSRGHCVIVEYASVEEATKPADRLAYEMLGIMKE